MTINEGRSWVRWFCTKSGGMEGYMTKDVKIKTYCVCAPVCVCGWVWVGACGGWEWLGGLVQIYLISFKSCTIAGFPLSTNICCDWSAIRKLIFIAPFHGLRIKHHPWPRQESFYRTSNPWHLCPTICTTSRPFGVMSTIWWIPEDIRITRKHLGHVVYCSTKVLLTSMNAVSTWFVRLSSAEMSAMTGNWID